MISSVKSSLIAQVPVGNSEKPSQDSKERSGQGQQFVRNLGVLAGTLAFVKGASSVVARLDGPLQKKLPVNSGNNVGIPAQNPHPEIEKDLHRLKSRLDHYSNRVRQKISSLSHLNTKYGLQYATQQPKKLYLQIAESVGLKQYETDSKTAISLVSSLKQDEAEFGKLRNDIFAFIRQSTGEEDFGKTSRRLAKQTLSSTYGDVVGQKFVDLNNSLTSLEATLSVYNKSLDGKVEEMHEVYDGIFYGGKQIARLL